MYLCVFRTSAFHVVKTFTKVLISFFSNKYKFKILSKFKDRFQQKIRKSKHEHWEYIMDYIP